VDSESSLYGFDANLVCNLARGCRGRLDLFGGYRFLALEEELTITEDLLALDGNTAVTPGTRFQVLDRFRTENYFHGGQIGLSGEYRAGNLIVGGRGSVALGVTHSEVEIAGSTVVTSPGQASAAFAGGLLAQPTNSGRFEEDEFAVVPEVGVTLGYQVLPGLRATVGYNFLYWSQVLRPGEQIDLTVNPTQLPPGTLAGPAVPARTGRSSDLFVHGLTFGVELRY
jgi:hypothetical protein